MRRFYWYFTAYLRKHGKVLIGSILVAIVVFSVVVPSLVKLLEQEQRDYIGLIGSYTLDNLPPSVLEKISFGLTSTDQEGNPVPAVAERWVVENEGHNYRFVIKKNLQWHDGQKLVPTDLQYQFRNVNITTTPNDIIFNLPEVFVPFPNVVAKPALRYIPERYWLFKTRQLPIGLGPYRVANYRENNHQLQEIVLDGPQHQLIYRFYLTENQAIQAFKRGEVDVLPDLSSRSDIFDWKTVKVKSTLRSDRYLAVFFDNANPMFEKNIRQALAYALPKPTDNSRATGPINPQSWAYLETTKDYSYDLSRAVERALDQLPTQPMVFTLTTTANFQTEAEQIKKSWEEFGHQAVQACRQKSEIKDKSRCDLFNLSISLKVTNFPDTNDFQVLLIGQQIPTDPDQYSLWHSQQRTNFTHYKNTRIDSLLEKGRTTTNQNERLAIYQEFQQFFLEDAPVIFIKYLPSYEISRQ